MIPFDNRKEKIASMEYGDAEKLIYEWIVSRVIDLKQFRTLNMINKEKYCNELKNPCDCENKAQCWEPCGDLGKSEDHVRIKAIGIESLEEGDYFYLSYPLESVVVELDMEENEYIKLLSG